MPKVFISATSRELKSCRAVVAEWAKAHGYDVVVQDDFDVQSDYGTIVQMLRDKRAPCDAVIHLAGQFYGFEPTNTPTGEQRRSYTQLEYELGKELRRQVFRFIARDDFPPDQPITQTDEQHELQRRHRVRLTQGSEPYSASSRTTGNELYYEFSTHDELRQLLDKLTIRTTVAKPRNLPFGSIGSLFKGRDDFLLQLRRALVDKPTHIAAVTAKQAIHGLGGVGKTRLALEYGWHFEHEYTALLFVTADSPANLERNLADLCGALVLNLPEKDAREQSVQVAAALRWLREHAGWFLILDNVDTEEAASAVEKQLKDLSTGHVVITSRLAHWSRGVEALELGVLSEEAATDFLLERTAGKRRTTPTDAADALALARELDCLALALKQAGAFIVKHGTRLADYHQRWKAMEPKVLEWFDERAMQYPKSVAVTWQTSIEQMVEDGRRLLDVLCWLAPDPIPRSMIEKLTQEEGEPAIDVETGMAELTTYSLAKWTADRDGILVYKLVEEITRYRLPKAEREGWLKRALRMVDEFFPGEPDDVRNWPVCLAARPHALAIVGHAESIGDPPPTSRLLNELGQFFHARAEFDLAEDMMRRTLCIDEASFGDDHHNVAIRLNNLAQLLQDTNRLGEAEPLMRRALRIDESSFGADHPNVAIRLNNLALLLQDTNRLGEAEPLMRRGLGMEEHSKGADHPHVAIQLNNLALLLQATNRLGEAEPLMRRALRINEASFGADHPNVASDLNNLALLLHATNRLGEAEPLMRRALAIFQASLGDDHPNTQLVRKNHEVLLAEIDAASKE